ncbi:hypothetical protein ACGYLO_17950 [Sulfitobacter sp. 1A13353]|uniref:hypothetical protein n=1 Tax=Sulfitobacter sp. 1A13353 TaxID=3368568 RepID=UPI003745CA19
MTDQNNEHPEDLLTWPDGETAERSEYDRGDWNHKSDDFEVTPVDQRVDHFDENITIPELYEQLSIALKSMGTYAALHFDNDDVCLEVNFSTTGFANDFEAALKKVATAVILKEVPEVSTGVRAFGDVLLDPSTGITFWGWKVGEKTNEELTGDDGRPVDPASLAPESIEAEVSP